MLHDDEPQAADAGYDAAPPSVWERLQGVFSPKARLRSLNRAIVEFPDVPANYVLRGELLLKRGDLFGAIADFRKGYELAALRLEEEDWGVVAQGLQDRALVGLRDALYRAARYNLDTTPDDTGM